MSVPATYHYPLKPVGPIPPGSFAGQVSLADPWIAGRTFRLNVSGKPRHLIRAFPSRLLLEIGGSAHEGASARFRVSAAQGSKALHVEADGGDSSPLVVEQVGSLAPDGAHSYVVRWRSGRPVAERTFHILIHADGLPDSESLKVPVLVGSRGELK